MYFLKSKGTSKIQDFVQIRDENFSLIAHFKLSELEKKINELKLGRPAGEIIEKIKKAEFEKIYKF